MMAGMKRGELDNRDIEKAIQEISHKVFFRLAEKGRGVFIGPHECYGLLAEEFSKELLDAMHANDPVQFRKELIDIAVVCVVGMASSLPPDTPAKAEAI